MNESVFKENFSVSIHKYDDASVSFTVDKQPMLSAQVQPGEFFVFKIVVNSGNTEIQGLELEYSDLLSETGANRFMDAKQYSCINIEKTDAYGTKQHTPITIEKNKTQILWTGIHIPDCTHPGLYSGKITIVTANSGNISATLRLTVAGEVLDDCGDNEPWRLSRIRWFNSTRGNEDSVTKPYIPLKVQDNILQCLGRKIYLNALGFPEQIISMFSQSVDELLDTEKEILAKPISFSTLENGCNNIWEVSSKEFCCQSDSMLKWTSEAISGDLSLQCQGSLESDGYMTYKLILKANADISFDDVRLDIPFNSETAKYTLGLGLKGGFTPEEYVWKWDPSTQQDSLWIGDVNAGIQIKLKGSNYVKPFVNIYYKHRPLNMPEGWYNEGKGEVKLLRNKNGITILRAASGALSLKSGETMEFNFDILVTPFKPIDMKKHWNTRYYHPHEYNAGNISEWITNAEKAGANVINIHHGNDLHPFINYPFIEASALREFIDEAHKNNIKTKIYYTVREISDRMHELPVMRSLGNEILPDPNGAEPSFLWQNDAARWVKERLGDDLIPAWKHTFKNGKYKDQIDAAVLSDGTSRMINYYVEGLYWLLKNCHIDGLYIDDTDCDRNAMRRTRSVLDGVKDGCLIDFHSWNHMNPRAGMVSSTNLYMSLFPYLDRLWFGEGFDYNSPPEYWITEICGIPYGLTGEMLRGGGNPWRGMLFGMTNRLGWTGKSPEPLWKIWDQFGIQDSKMLGFWDDRCPVKTDHEEVYATAYLKKDKIIVAVASWADSLAEFTLKVQWKSINLDQHHLTLTIPFIPDFQDECIDLSCDTPLRIEPGKGLIIIIGSRI